MGGCIDIPRTDRMGIILVPCLLCNIFNSPIGGDIISNLIDFMAWVPIISLLIYVPIVCYLDWKVREVEPIMWLGLVIVNLPITILFYLGGLYLWWMFVISLIAITIYYAAMLMHYIEGADFMYIMFILLFFIYNPISGHWLMALPFSIFFAACTGIAGIWVLTYNLVKGNGVSFEFDRGFPMMIPISAALVLTVMLA
jgi:hypothetical protein